MEWFWPEGFYTIVMVGVFAVASFAFKQPIAVALAIAAIIGALVKLSPGNAVWKRDLEWFEQLISELRN